MSIITALVKLTMYIFSIFLIPLCKLLTLGRRKVCPPLQNSLLLYSANELAHLIRTREFSSEEIVEAYITRILEVNKVLNAVVEDRFREAIDEAKSVDKLIGSATKTSDELKKEYPLLGVPITIKGSISVKGLSNAAGAVTSEKSVAHEDADVVRMCKESGAIPLLISNTPELCMFWETFNKVTGKTLNPYDTRRTVGGSSGGEAALIGSGSSVIGLGSDIAGSLRLPTMYTGIFGHKCSPGVISLQGHNPSCSDERWPQFFTLGPMTRYAEDLKLLFSVVVKPEMRSVLKIDEEVSVRDIKFYYMDNNFDCFLFNKVDNTVVQGMETFAKYLQEQYGIEAKKVHIDLMKHSFGISVPILLDINKVSSPFYDETKDSYEVFPEFFKFITCRSSLVFPTLSYGLLKKFFIKFGERGTAKAIELNKKLRSEFQELLGDNGVFLYPTFPSAAHYHYSMYYKIPNIAYMTIFNSLGLPVTNCPIGLNSEKLPVGIQVATNPNNDRLTLAVANEIEKCFGRWKPHFNEAKDKSIQYI